MFPMLSLYMMLRVDLSVYVKKVGMDGNGTIEGQIHVIAKLVISLTQSKKAPVLVVL